MVYHQTEVQNLQRTYSFKSSSFSFLHHFVSIRLNASGQISFTLFDWVAWQHVVLLCLQYFIPKRSSPLAHIMLLYLKILKVGACFLPRGSHDKKEIWSQHKWNSFLINSKEAFVISKDMAKIDMKEITLRKTNWYYKSNIKNSLGWI